MDANACLYAAPLQLLEVTGALPTHISLEPLLFQAQSSFSLSIPQNLAKHRPSHHSASHKPGRRVTSSNQILHLFTRIYPNHKKQPPKLENLRYSVLRTFRKALKQLQRQKPLSKAGLLDVDMREGAGREALVQFCECMALHRQAVDIFLKPEERPQVDNMTKKAYCGYQTYNGSYLRHIFSVEAVKALYRTYVGLLCADLRPSSMCARFKIKCCERTAHSMKCDEKWAKFRSLLQGYLGADLPQQ